MSMQDPVSDMLTQLRNAQMMGIRTTRFAHSKFKEQILHVLKGEGYIEGFQAHEEGSKKVLEVALKYFQGRPVIESIKRISKPSLRVYRGYTEFPAVRGGMGISIVSTPKGVMADKAARAQKLGGEVLCTVE
jgi:small subunit ribosomal protein S8